MIIGTTILLYVNNNQITMNYVLRDEQQIDGARIVNKVEEGQCSESSVGRMNAAIEHQRLALELHHDAAATDLTARSDRRHLQQIDVAASTLDRNRRSSGAHSGIVTSIIAL